MYIYTYIHKFHNTYRKIQRTEQIATASSSETGSLEPGSSKRNHASWSFVIIWHFMKNWSGLLPVKRSAIFAEHSEQQPLLNCLMPLGKSLQEFWISPHSPKDSANKWNRPAHLKGGLLEAAKWRSCHKLPPNLPFFPCFSLSLPLSLHQVCTSSSLHARGVCSVCGLGL